MARFQIDGKVFDKLPDACFGAVVAKSVDNAAELTAIRQLLDGETQAARQRLEGVNLKEYEGIAPYREAFVALGINPNKFMCSVEALAKRVQKGNALPAINPIVDLGNAMSLKYLLPMGAHDIDKLTGDLEVRFARPGDSFTPIGGGEAEAPDPEELVYASGSTVKTRRWIWRQSEDGKIDSGSRNVVFPIDGFLNSNRQAVLSAQEELAALLKELFACQVAIGLLTRDNPGIQL